MHWDEKKLCDHEILVKMLAKIYQKDPDLIQTFLRIKINDQKIGIPPCGSPNGKKIRIQTLGSQIRSNTILHTIQISSGDLFNGKGENNTIIHKTNMQTFAVPLQYFV